MAEPKRRKVLGGANILVAVLLLGGVWGGLPARWWPIDTLGTLLALALVVSGVGLIRAAPWGVKVAKAVAASSLAIGLALTTGLAVTAGQLSGLYGPVGMGGAVILGTFFLLLVPYLVVFPAAQLYALMPRDEG